MAGLVGIPGRQDRAGRNPSGGSDIREELDAEIYVGDLLETVEWDYPAFHLTMHCFLCTLKSVSLHLNEHESAAWLTRETIHSVKWLPADEGLASKIKDILQL